MYCTVYCILYVIYSTVLRRDLALNQRAGANGQISFSMFLLISKILDNLPKIVDDDIMNEFWKKHDLYFLCLVLELHNCP